MATMTDKLGRILSKIQERTGLSNLVPGSKAYQLAQANAYEQMQTENKLELYARRNSIESAEGSELDDIGDQFFGIARLGESRPFVSTDMKAIKFYVYNGTFGSVNDGSDIVIYEGTTISGTVNSSTYVFRVSEQVTLDKDDTECYIAAELIQGKYDTVPANVLTKHNYTSYAGALGDGLKVINPVVIGTGRAKESDNNYRYRIVNALKAFPTTTYSGIYNLISGLPGVSDVYIETSANGGGTFTAYVQGLSPITSDSIITNVESVLQSVIPPWVNYTVVKPNYLGIELNVDVKIRQTVDLQQYTTIQNILIDKISTYINNFYGTEFYLYDIISIINDLNYDIISVTITSATLYSGEDNAREATTLDPLSKTESVTITNKDKLIVEPKTNSIVITVS